MVISHIFKQLILQSQIWSLIQVDEAKKSKRDLNESRLAPWCLCMGTEAKFSLSSETSVLSPNPDQHLQPQAQQQLLQPPREHLEPFLWAEAARESSRGSTEWEQSLGHPLGPWESSFLEAHSLWVCGWKLLSSSLLLWQTPAYWWEQCLPSPLPISQLACHPAGPSLQTGWRCARLCIRPHPLSSHLPLVSPLWPPPCPLNDTWGGMRGLHQLWRTHINLHKDSLIAPGMSNMSSLKKRDLTVFLPLEILSQPITLHS